jgi:hypothetical protein
MKKLPLVRSFPFDRLKLFNFFDLAVLLMEHALTALASSSIGLGHAYTALKKEYERLEDILKRNPALRQTEPINELMGQLRQALVTLKGHIQLALRETGTLLTAAKEVDFVSKSYLKQSYYTTQSGIAATARELVAELKKPATLEHVTTLGLLDKVNHINHLQQELNNLISARGEEMEYDKALGSATAARRDLEIELRNVLYTVLPALYQLAPNAEARTAIEEVAFHANGQIDAFRHLVNEGGGNGNGGSDGSGSDDEIIIETPEDPTPETPDPETPPSGGGNGGGSDEGSGGPVDRNNIIINIKE